MKLPPTEILNLLYQNLNIPFGRHLYAVLGTYQGLTDFTKSYLSQAKRPDGQTFPDPIPVNQILLNMMGPETLQEMINKESTRPRYITSQLSKGFDRYLRQSFEADNFLILHQCELLFAYSQDLSILRRWAANQNHILVLLPGEMHGNHVYLFHEADAQDVVKFDNQLFAENNIWEISNEH